MLRVRPLAKEAAVYGTLGRMTPKAGERDELIALMSAPPAGAAANGYRAATSSRPTRATTSSWP